MSRGPNKQFEPEVALSRAMEVFKERGYEAASLAQLLKQMGISRKSMYDTFGNKQSLFLKVLEYYAQTELRSIREQLLGSGSPLSNLERLLSSWQKAHGQPESKGCLIGTCVADFNTSDMEIAPILRSYYRQLEKIYYEAIALAQTAGELNPKASTSDLAKMLLYTTQGMALVGRVSNSKTMTQSVVSTVIKSLKRA